MCICVYVWCNNIGNIYIGGRCGSGPYGQPKCGSSSSAPSTRSQARLDHRLSVQPFLCLRRGPSLRLAGGVGSTVHDRGGCCLEPHLRLHYALHAGGTCRQRSQFQLRMTTQQSFTFSYYLTIIIT